MEIAKEIEHANKIEEMIIKIEVGCLTTWRHRYFATNTSRSRQVILLDRNNEVQIHENLEKHNQVQNDSM